MCNFSLESTRIPDFGTVGHLPITPSEPPESATDDSSGGNWPSLLNDRGAAVAGGVPERSIGFSSEADFAAPTQPVYRENYSLQQ